MTGLWVVRAFWAADGELRTGVPGADPVYFRQVFTDPSDPRRAQWVGYGLRPEGVRLELRAQVVDGFLDRELAALGRDGPRRRWHRGQMLRYLLVTRCGAAGLNRFEARQLADLCITAAACPDLKDEVKAGFSRGNAPRLADALRAGWERYLSCQPNLTEQRITNLLGKLTDSGALGDLLPEIWNWVNDDSRFRQYLHSVLLHGLLIGLRHRFVLHGRGDERAVIAHTQLPIEFDGHTDNRLIVCERGQGGDGTTRAFVGEAEEALAEWRRERFVACENAAADEVLERAFGRTGDHERWRGQDPRDPVWVETLASELGLDPKGDTGPLQVVLRLLYEGVELDGQRFEYYDLYRETREVRTHLAAAFGREPLEWELVGAVVERAKAADPAVPHWTGLLERYRGFEDAVQEESLSPEARLADQVYRMGTRLCLDGCLGCLHGNSDLMDGDAAAVATSRTLLERFGAYVGTLG